MYVFSKPMKTSQKQFLGEYVQQQRQIKYSNAFQDRNFLAKQQQQQQQYEDDNYYDDYNEEEDADDMPGLEDAEGNSPTKSPKKNMQVKSINLDGLSNIENAQKKELQQQQNQQFEKKQQEQKTIFRDDFLEDSPREFYPRIQNYYPGAAGNRITECQESIKERDQMKAEEETKIIEKYLNKVFPEDIQEEQELAYEQIISKQIDDNTKEKNKLLIKRTKLDTDIWREPQLKKELKDQYKNQLDYLSKINNLYSDKLILKNNIKEKEKKIKEIQRVLRDLNDKKQVYLDMHNAEKIDLIEQKYKEINQKEISELLQKLSQSEKDRDLYKMKFEVYKDKYEIIMKEANETKHIIQDQIKDLLNYKMAIQQQKKEENKKPEEKKTTQADIYHNRIKQKNQKQSLGSSFNQFNQQGGQNNNDDTNQGIISLNSQQNINIQASDKNLTNSFQLSSSSQQNQKQSNNMHGQKTSPPTTPPLNPNAFPLSPIMTPLSNQNTPITDFILSSSNHNNNQNNSNNNNQNNYYSPFGQSHKSKNFTNNYDTENSENNSNNNNIFIQQQQQQQQLQQQQQSQQQQLLGQTPNINGNNPDIRISTQLTPLNLESTPANHAINNQSDSKKQKKPQVQFQDLVNTPEKGEDTEQNDFYNKLCASKIKNMVKAIQLQHPKLIEESTFNFRR